MADANPSNWVAQSVFAALDILVPKDGAPFAAAVSGGSDSYAMLVLAADWAKRRNRKLIAATVDHGLRAEARAEAAWVSAKCAELGIAHDTLIWSAPKNSDVNQSLARDGRHRLIYDWARQNDASRILLGHTLSDSEETCLMRARAGSSWFGCAGPAAVSAPPLWPDGLGLQLIRPLLGLSRTEIKTWLTQKGCDWISDPSNTNPAYERVRTRKRIAALDDEARTSLTRSVIRLRLLRQAEIQALSDWSDAHLFETPDGALTCSLDALQQLSQDRRARALSWMAMCASGASLPPRLSRIGELTARMTQDAKGSETLGDAWLNWNQNQLQICRRPFGAARSTGAPEAALACRLSATELIWDNRFVITLAADAPDPELISHDAAQARGLSIETLPDWREMSDPRARRSLPVIVNAEGAAQPVSLTPDVTPHLRPLVQQRLRALVNERQWTN